MTIPDTFIQIDISIHAPLAGSDNNIHDFLDKKTISIHAPLAGSDPATSTCSASRANFNPRSPCGERLVLTGHVFDGLVISIHAPLAGSDLPPPNAVDLTTTDFNPRSPCGERPCVFNVIAGGGEISIHAPLAGSDYSPDCPGIEPIAISIHAPLAGSDVGEPDEFYRPGYFNPRSPCGERPTQSLLALNQSLFQSTLPLRGATHVQHGLQGCFLISIHAPLAGSDIVARVVDHDGADFNPRSPCGERLALGRRNSCTILISIHAPLAGSDTHYTMS